MKKKAIVIIVIIIVLALLAAGWYFFLRKGAGPNSAKAYVMPVKEISSNAMASGMSNRYAGVVEPQETKDIQTDTSKTVSEVFVKPGDSVKVGDPLFRYSVDSMKLDLEQLNVDLQSAQSIVKERQESYENAEGTDKEIYYIQLIEAKGQVTKVQKAIAAKKEEINNSVVNSPIEGTIQTVSDQNQQMYEPSNAFITIMAEGKYLVKAKISEMNVYQIYTGQEMLIRSRVDETKTWKGTISTIDTNSTDNNNQGMYYGGGGESASKYSFYVALDDPEGLLLGQHVTVENAVESAPEYKGILLGEYYIDGMDEKPFVWKDVNGKLQKSYVELGQYNEMTGEYDVISGLSASDYIAYPAENLREGMPTTTEYVEPEFFPEEGETMDPGAVIEGPGFMEGVPQEEFTEEGSPEAGPEFTPEQVPVIQPGAVVPEGKM